MQVTINKQGGAPQKFPSVPGFYSWRRSVIYHCSIPGTFHFTGPVDGPEILNKAMESKEAPLYWEMSSCPSVYCEHTSLFLPWTAQLVMCPCQLWHSRREKAHCPVAISSQNRTCISSVTRQRIFRHRGWRVFPLFLRLCLTKNVLPALNFPFSPQIITAFTEGSASALFSPSSNAWRTVKLK